MLRDIAVAIMLLCPRAIPLAMITIRKSTYGFPFLSYMSMGLRLVALQAAGVPLVLKPVPNVMLLPCETIKSGTAELGSA